MRLNLNSIKAVYRAMPPWMAAPLLLLPFEVFAGRSYLQTRSLLHRYDAMSAEDKRKVADARLLQYMNECVQHVPFYKDHFKSKGEARFVSAEEIGLFPVISKEHLAGELERFLDPRFEKRRYVVTTGGTTGAQTKLFMSNCAYGAEWAFVSWLLAKRGIGINSKRLCLRGVDAKRGGALVGYNLLYKEMLVSPFGLSEAMVLAAIGDIRRFNPKWIHGYPSSVAEFARVVLGLGCQLPDIDAVLLVSEALYPEQEEVIRRAFGCEVITFYGMTERVIFAPFSSGHFVPHPLYGKTESVDGELVGTGFLNRATRVVRYRTGDLAGGFRDGERGVEFDRVLGRWGKEYLTGRNGVRITMTALNTHADCMAAVKRYQFFQVVPGECELRLLVSGDFDAVDGAQRVASVFQEKVGDELIIRPVLVKDIPLSVRGKHRFIVSELKS